jgi:hypothetical protein
MVGTSANNTDSNAIPLVPASKPVYDIDAVPGVEIIDGSFTVDSPYLFIVSNFARLSRVKDFRAREEGLLAETENAGKNQPHLQAMAGVSERLCHIR